MDIAEFQKQVQEGADELLFEVIERMLDRLLEIPDPVGHGCSYALFEPTYVKLKLLVRKLSFDCNYDRDVKYVQMQHTDGSIQIVKREDWANKFQSRIDEMKPRIEKAHRKMYLKPCKTCTTCQTRRKPWPTQPSLTS